MLKQIYYDIKELKSLGMKQKNCLREKRKGRTRKKFSLCLSFQKIRGLIAKDNAKAKSDKNGNQNLPERSIFFMLGFISTISRFTTRKTRNDS